MKKTSFVFAFTFIFFTGYSQIEKGTKSIGLSFSMNQESTKYQTNTTSNNYDHRWFSFGATSDFNYFLKNNFSIGCSLGYSYLYDFTNSNYTTEVFYTDKSLTNRYSGAFNSSYYFQLSDRFYFSITGAFIYSYGITLNDFIQETDAYFNETKTKKYSNSFSLQFTPSIHYFIHPKLGLKASFGNLYYTMERGEIADVTFDNHENNYSYGLNLSSTTFNLGLNYYFK